MSKKKKTLAARRPSASSASLTLAVNNLTAVAQSAAATVSAMKAFHVANAPITATFGTSGAFSSVVVVGNGTFTLFGAQHNLPHVMCSAPIFGGDLGDVEEVIIVPEPMSVPDHVPEETPIVEPEKEPVPA